MNQNLQKCLVSNVLLNVHREFVQLGIEPEPLKYGYLIYFIQCVFTEKQIDHLMEGKIFNEEDEARLSILVEKVTELCSDYISELLEAHT